MKELGVSIYPSQSEPERDKAYLKRAAELGFTRIFTSMLEVEGDGRDVVDQYRELIEYGNDLGMRTSLDVNPKLMERLGVTPDDLSFFKELGADSVRMDLGLDGMKDALMTKNEEGLGVEVNMSSGTKFIDQLMSYVPNRRQLLASHNFYPMRYSGLSREHFDQTTAQFNAYRLNTAAFVTSQDAEMGPWPLQEGLCTLEEHRDLPLAVQVSHYKELDTIDDLLIGNAYASEDELRAAAEAFFSPHVLIPVVFEPEATDLERRIVLDELHVYRGDRSEYLIRSTMTRVKFKDEKFPPHAETPDLRRGDVLIGNDNFDQYKGETQVALTELPNRGERNVVARVQPGAEILLDDLAPWSTFKFVEA